MSRRSNRTDREKLKKIGAKSDLTTTSISYSICWFRGRESRLGKKKRKGRLPPSLPPKIAIRSSSYTSKPLLEQRHLLAKVTAVHLEDIEIDTR
jgi:hypothetical protein